MPLPVSQQSIEQMNVGGFIPVIINVLPIDLPLILGLSENEGTTPRQLSDQQQGLTPFEKITAHPQVSMAQ